MKKNSPSSTEDSDAKILQYVDGNLSPEEREAFDEAVRNSAESFRELKVLELLTSALKSHKEEIFCPEIWELYDFAMKGEDTSEAIGRHLEHCSECREEVASFRKPVVSETMTPAIHVAFREHFANVKNDKTGQFAVPLFTRVRKYFTSLFGTPIAPLATAVALAVLIIMVYPRGDVETRLGLSSVRWTQDMGVPKSIFKRPRAVVIVAFKGFGKPMPQERIDSIYRQLEPSNELLQKLDLVSPTMLKNALADQSEKPVDRKALFPKLRDDFKASRLLLITVSPSKNLFDVLGELVDLKTGCTEKELKITGISEDKLPQSIGSLSSLLVKD